MAAIIATISSTGITYSVDGGTYTGFQQGDTLTLKLDSTLSDVSELRWALVRKGAVPGSSDDASLYSGDFSGYDAADSSSFPQLAFNVTAHSGLSRDYQLVIWREVADDDTTPAWDGDDTLVAADSLSVAVSAGDAVIYQSGDSGDEVVVLGTMQDSNANGLRGNDDYIITRHQKGDLSIRDFGGSNNRIILDKGVVVKAMEAGPSLFGVVTSLTLTLDNDAEIHIHTPGLFTYHIGGGGALTFAQMQAVLNSKLTASPPEPYTVGTLYLPVPGAQAAPAKAAGQGQQQSAASIDSGVNPPGNNKDNKEDNNNIGNPQPALPEPDGDTAPSGPSPSGGEDTTPGSGHSSSSGGSGSGTPSGDGRIDLPGGQAAPQNQQGQAPQNQQGSGQQMTINGTDGDDFMLLGKAVDGYTYAGGKGDDLYVISRHQTGSAVISDSEGNNIVKLDEGVRILSVKEKPGSGGSVAVLTLQIGEVTQEIDISIGDPQNSVFSFQVGDGVVTNYQDFVTFLKTLTAGTADIWRVDSGFGYNLVIGDATAEIIHDDSSGGPATTVGDDWVLGLGGDDVIRAGAGDDVLQGGAGADTLDGGTGEDTASYRGSASGVRVDLSMTGAQTGLSGAAQTAGVSANKHLVLTETLAGDGNSIRWVLSAETDAPTETATKKYVGEVNDDGDGFKANTGSAHWQQGITFASDIASLAANTHFSNGDAAGDVISSIENLVGSSHDDWLQIAPQTMRVDGGDGVDTVSFDGAAFYTPTAMSYGHLSFASLPATALAGKWVWLENTATHYAFRYSTDGTLPIASLGLTNDPAKLTPTHGDVLLGKVNADGTGLATNSLPGWLSLSRNTTDNEPMTITMKPHLSLELTGLTAGHWVYSELNTTTGAISLQKAQITDPNTLPHAANRMQLGYTDSNNAFHFLSHLAGNKALSSSYSSGSLTISLTMKTDSEGNAIGQHITDLVAHDTLWAVKNDDGDWMIELAGSTAPKTGAVKLATYSMDSFGDGSFAFESGITGFTDMAQYAFHADNGGFNIDINALPGVVIDLDSRRDDDGYAVQAADMHRETMHLKGIENLVGTELSDSLSGTAGANHIDGARGHDTIAGRGGADVLEGGHGNDLLIGGAGADLLDGGVGIADTASYAASSAGVTVDLSYKIDGETLTSGWSGVTAPTVDTTTDGGKYVIGSFSAGSWSFSLKTAKPTYSQKLAQGQKVVLGQLSADASSLEDGHSPLLSLTSGTLAIGDLSVEGVKGGDAAGDILKDVENLIGSAFDDVLIGDDKINYLFGGAGDDKLFGGGNPDPTFLKNTYDTRLNGDVLEGGAGADWLDSGGAGGAVVHGMVLDMASYVSSTAGVTVSINSIGGIQAAVTGLVAASAAENDYVIAEQETGGWASKVVSDLASITNPYRILDKIVTHNNALTLLSATQENPGHPDISFDAATSTVTVLAQGAERLGAGTSLGGGHATGDVLLGMNGLIGSGHDDVLQGDWYFNYIRGGGGDDLIHYSPGEHPVAYKFAGDVDDIDGGAGEDVFSFALAEQFARGGNRHINQGVEVNLDEHYYSIKDMSAPKHKSRIKKVEHVIGSDRHDDLTGDKMDNRLDGGAGDDLLAGMAGDDILIGGSGNDTASWADKTAAVTINLSDGNTAKYRWDAATDSWVIGTGSNAGTHIRAVTGSGNTAEYDYLHGIENLIGGAGADTLTGDAGDNMLEGGAGADTLAGGAGTDTVSYASSSAGVTITINSATAGSGGDAAGDTMSGVENLIGSALADTLTGDAGDNTLEGGAGDDALAGGGGADLLIGGAGADTLTGGSGDDLMIGGAGADSFAGGAGIDTVNYAASSAGVTITINSVTAGSGGDAAGDTMTGVENVIGSALADTLIGDAGNNMLEGGAGTDRLDGKAGTDRLTGGAGNDDFILQNAATTYSAADVITDFTTGDNIDLGSSVTKVWARKKTLTENSKLVNVTVLYGGTTSVNTAIVYGVLLGHHNLTAADFSHITSNSNVDNAANRAPYHLGVDDIHISGGQSFADLDLARRFKDVDDETASLTFTATGLDGSGLTLSSAGLLSGSPANTNSGSYTFSIRATDPSGLFATAEDITLTIGQTLTASPFTGTAYNDHITGTTGDDAIDGGTGDDRLTGNGGNDSFTFTGTGFGQDVITDYNTGDHILLPGYTTTGNTANVFAIWSSATLTSAELVIYAGGNSVTLESLNPASLPTFSIKTASTDTSSLALPNLIVGTAAANTISTSSTAALTTTLVASTAGDDTIFGLGGDGTLSGGGGADVLFGGAGADTLNGEAGMDALIGGAGNDTMDGGAGDDEYFGAPGQDTYVFTGTGFGNDVIHGYDFTTTAGQQETIDIAGFTSTDIGMAAHWEWIPDDPTMPGQMAQLVISLGPDASITIDRVDNSETMGDGYKVIDSSDAAVAMPNLFMGSVGDDDMTGESSTVRETFIGFGGVDFIDGGSGTDTVSFVDKLDVGVSLNLADTTKYDDDGEVDSTGSWFRAWTDSDSDGTVDDSGSPGNPADEFDFVVNIENIIGGHGNDSFTGNSSANRLVGGRGTDTLNGGGGDDILIGGAGTDTLNGGAGADFLIGGAGADTLTGGDGVDLLIGGAGADSLTGGAGADVFGLDLFSGARASDRVTDFADGTDTIGIDASLISGKTPGDTVSAGDLTTLGLTWAQGSGANASHVVLTYNSTTVMVLENETLADITAADFEII